MNLFDLHCDSAFEIYRTKSELFSNNLSVSVDKYLKYNKKAQVFAVWSDQNKTDDEAYLDFLHVSADLKEQIAKNSDYVTLCTNAGEIDKADEKLCAVLAVEDARLVGNDLSRLERLYDAGVRLITLGWEGKTRVCGGYDTDDGLTPLGFEVLSECERLGIVVDVSHLSEKSFWDVAGKATRPFCASHSNSMMLCSHRRNLTDTQFRTVAASGGVVGISFVGKHLSALLENGASDEGRVYETVCAHIEHFLEIEPSAVCIGSDFDGTERLIGLEDVSCAENLARALSNRGSSDKTVSDVFYNNACDFFHRALKN